MCREVMRTANTFSPPWLSNGAPPPLAICLSISKLQRTPSGQQKTEAGFGEWGVYLVLIFRLHCCPETVWSSLFSHL